MEPAKPTVELHGLRGQAAKSTQMLDDRAEGGHHPNGIVVKLDGTREVGQSWLDRDFRRVNRKWESRTDRVVGLFLELIGNHGRHHFLGVPLSSARTSAAAAAIIPRLMMAPSLRFLGTRVLSAKYNRSARVLRIELQNFHQSGEVRLISNADAS